MHVGTFHANGAVTGTLVLYRHRPAKSHQAVHLDWYVAMQTELTHVAHHTANRGACHGCLHTNM